MKKHLINDYHLLTIIGQPGGIECVTEIEDGYLAVCGNFQKF